MQTESRAQRLDQSLQTEKTKLKREQDNNRKLHDQNEVHIHDLEDSIAELMEQRKKAQVQLQEVQSETQSGQSALTAQLEQCKRDLAYMRNENQRTQQAQKDAESASTQWRQVRLARSCT